ncbi:MAG TPA: Gldg family protein [Acidimicrobiia bacterium]|nr:Gldg family protein [Acidimicrobiia bacterium]
MSRAVFGREVRALVALPQTYGIAAGFLAISGLFFVTFVLSERLPDLERYYSNIATTLIVLAPVVAMRSFAEERRNGALDVALSWPIPRRALVAGKYGANLAFTWLLLSVAWLYVRVLSHLGRVEVGKAASGFVGLLLLAAAFNAIALAVSARSASPTAASFLGFAVLLGLWTLQYTQGHLLGDRLALLAPSTHLEAAERGVLDAGDVAYFAACTALGLAAAVAALDGQRSGSAPYRRRRRRFTAAAVAGAGVALSVGAPAVHAQVDLTPTKRYTVTSQTRAVARRLPGPVHLTGFVDPDSVRAVQLRAVVRQYQAAGIPVHLEIVDPDEEPSRARHEGIQRYGQVLVDIGGRRELVDDVGQIPLTSAINRLTRPPATVCFTVGHGEGDIDDENPQGFKALAGALRGVGLEPTPLALGAAGARARLDRCAVVVAAPRLAFLPEEVDLLREFTAARGRLLALVPPGSDARAQLNDVPRPFGLTFGPGIVSDRSALAGDPASVVAFAYPSEHPVTRILKRDNIPTLFVEPSPVERANALPEQASLVPLVATSSHSRLPDGTKGPFTLAAVADWSAVTAGPAGARGPHQPPPTNTPGLSRRVVAAVGSVEPATNRLLGAFGNHDLVSGLVQWIARDDDLIASGRSFGGVDQLLLTSADRRYLVRSGVVLPTVAAAVPLPVALRRLRRG